MDGPGGIRRNGPTDRLVMVGASHARTCRERTYELSQGGNIRFLLPRMKDLDKGGVVREATIELGPEKKYSIKFFINKSPLFRFEQETNSYNDLLVKQRNAGKSEELLDELQKYVDSLVILKQAMILLELDESGRKLGSLEMPIITAILEDMTTRRHGLEMLIAREEMAYPFGLEAQMREKLGVNL